MLPQEILGALQMLLACKMVNCIASEAAVDVDEVGGAEGAPEARALGRDGGAEEGSAEVGELAAEAGEHGGEGGAVGVKVAVAPALVVVAAAQLTVLESAGGGAWRVRPLRRHCGPGFGLRRSNSRFQGGCGKIWGWCGGQRW